MHSMVTQRPVSYPIKARGYAYDDSLFYTPRRRRLIVHSMCSLKEINERTQDVAILNLNIEPKIVWM